MPLLGVGGQTVVQGPSNTAAVVGTQAEMTCSTSNVPSSQINWQFTPIGSTRTLVAVSCSTFAPGYNVTAPDPLSCNLIISSVTLAQAGLYSCTPGFNDGVSAQLVVLGKKRVFKLIIL